jgi:hypothetical protein
MLLSYIGVKYLKIYIKGSQIMGKSTLHKLAKLSKKKVSIGSRIKIDEDLAEALKIIEEKADVKKNVIIEEALKQYGILKMAEDLEKKGLSGE